jgi:general secretion pathway protein D
MIQRNSKYRSCFTLFVGVLLCAAVQAQAQGQRGTTGGTRGAGGARSGSTGGSREYYSNGEVGDAMITVDPETRRLVIIADDETGQYISQVVSNLDRPRPQVLIKVVFLEVTYRNGSDIGVEGSYQRNFNSITTNSTISSLFGLASQGTSPQIPYTSMTGAGIYQVMGTDFQATLRAIAEAGKLEVLSRPAILARNSQQATITVGQQVPLITNTRFDNFGNQINSVTYRDVGIILLVTPFITSDGMVEMIVSPQISSLSDQTIPISSGGTNGAPIGAPIINIRSADTVVVTPDGQTVVIGGLMQNQKTQTETKIPFLGDIPVLGNLFKRKLKQDVKTELLIFLTPRIVAEPAQLAGMSAKERSDTTLVPKAFSDKELDRFLENVPSRENPPPPTKKGK